MDWETKTCMCGRKPGDPCDRCDAMRAMDDLRRRKQRLLVEIAALDFKIREQEIIFAAADRRLCDAITVPRAALPE